jgi:hypothetical protein
MLSSRPISMGLLAGDDLGGAVGKQRPHAQAHVGGRREEELGQQIDAADRHARADVPRANRHHGHQSLQEKELAAADAHAASSL